jgi:hypothetical protein
MKKAMIWARACSRSRSSGRSSHWSAGRASAGCSPSSHGDGSQPDHTGHHRAGDVCRGDEANEQVTRLGGHRALEREQSEQHDPDVEY